ncbi:MAG: DUF3237 domain-containing protein [Alphaproteobacteria bacterium]|nr:DUF3237 domain-containing protein [Alphaproteobacteria bacterium]
MSDAETIAPLPHRHLLTLRLDVDAAEAVRIGRTPSGTRVIAPVNGGSFNGDRLAGSVLPNGADWVMHRADGAMLIDVRLVLKAEDGPMIYMSYQGRFIGQPDAIARLARGEALSASDYSLAMVAKFECGDERYAWLNDVIAVGTGIQSGFDPIYTIYQIG